MKPIFIVTTPARFVWAHSFLRVYVADARAQSWHVVFEVDVSDRLQVEKMLQTTFEEFGRVDVLVNNAAIMKRGSLGSMDEKNLQEHLDINVRGCFNCCQLVARHMIKQRNGKRGYGPRASPKPSTQFWQKRC
jgi:NAD(P)-dependent dehydrogenase (short-subunit alcohol dehydrogenase family)